MREGRFAVSSFTTTGALAGRAATAPLLSMLWGIHISRCVYAAAELGIADALADGPQSSDALATSTGMHEPSLYRVLRLLAALGVFEEHDGRRFALTAMGARLCTGAQPGMRSWAVMLEALGGVRPFAPIVETIRTGVPGFELEFGSDLFAFLGQDPGAAAIFDAAMAERTGGYATSVADGHDFSDVRTIADVGGGDGTLLVEILRRHRHLSGILFETPSVAARANAVHRATDIGGRCEVLAGDFFTCVPSVDCHLLANVLHDWDDTRSIEILRRCRRAMRGAGRVLIVERLIPEDGSDPLPTLLSDINMLVLTGGRERSNGEYGALLRAAGLRPGAITPVAFPYGVIEGEPA
jgi:O-methyltransferase domain